MDKITQQILDFFSSINEFDKRTYIRDCTDILVNNHKELVYSYPSQAYMFIKIARIHYSSKSNDEFYNYMNAVSSMDEAVIDEFVRIITLKSIESLKKFNQQINILKNDEKYIGRSEVYEPSL